MVKRKEARMDEVNIIQYQMLTLKSFDVKGHLIKEELDMFNAREEIDSKYLTKQGDVIVRLSTPFTAVVIDEESEGLLVPSLFVIIRLYPDGILPSYMSIYLNSDKMKKIYNKESRGSTVQILKTSAFKEFEILVQDSMIQEKIVLLSQLMLREKRLLQSLIEENDKRNQLILEKMIIGGQKHGN